jgi:hypothetical protein
VSYLWTFAISACTMILGNVFWHDLHLGIDILWLGSGLFTHWLAYGRNRILVPRDPTEAMIQAGIAAWHKSPLAVVTQYKAMVEVADAG